MAEQNDQQQFLDLEGLAQLWTGIKAQSGGKRTARVTVGTSANGWTEKDCDFLCDGTADDVEIKAAISSIPTSGGVVVLLDGTYNITSNIVLSRENITLMGNGSNTVLARGFADSSAYGVVNIIANNCEVKDLSIDGVKASYTGSNNQGVYSGGDRVVVRNIIVKNCAGYGIEIQGNGCFVVDNTITDNASGVCCKGDNCEIAVNKISCSFNGIYMQGCSYLTIAKNVCTALTGYGIYGYGDIYNSAITGNVCNGTGKSGIDLDYGDNCSVAGNICNTNTEYGIYAYHDTNCTFVGNVCSGNTKYGIYITDGSTNNTFAGNICNGNTEYGLYCYGQNNAIAGNTCNQNQSYGIYVNNDSNTVTGNNCCGNTTGINIGTAENNTVTGNTCRLNQDYNIRLYSAHYNTVSANNVRVGPDDSVSPAPIYIQGTTNTYNIVVDNLVGDGTISNGGGTGNIVANTPQITSGTTDLTAGSSALATGALHFVYE